MTPRLRIVVRIIAAAVAVAMIAVLVQSLRRDGPAALDTWRAAHVRWVWIVISVACAFVGHAIYVIGWHRLLRDVGVRAPIWTLVRIFLVSNLGRYLPGGKAWQMAIIGMMAAERDLPAAPLAGTSLFQGTVGVGVGLAVLIATGRALVGLPSAALALPVMMIAGLLALPSLLRLIPKLYAIVVQRAPSVASIATSTMWTVVWTTAASWIMWGVALYALATGLLPAAGASPSAYIAAWAASFLAGLIAIVSPAGLGAREGAMQAVLERAGMVAADVLIVVVVARVWVTILDVVPALIVLLFRRYGRAGRATSVMSGSPAAMKSELAAQGSGEHNV